MASIEDIRALLDERLKPIEDRLDNLTTRLDNLTTGLDNLAAIVKVVSAKQQNSLSTRQDALVKVPLDNGQAPVGDFPCNLCELLVAGNEKLPNGQVNTWNRKKSKQLLQQYGDQGSDSSQDEDEHAPRSRELRLSLARRLGITTAQLNFAQLVL